MTHHRTGHGTHEFSCDLCPQAAEGERGEDFGETWSALKEQGWRCFKVGGEWVHRCPECAERRDD